ncbi:MULTISPECIES: TonB-dependent receptor [unclassified Caulobacter]|uniref:TonB-dependent receptor n=1 Tax=unclassified Caulobacter TaxID=2648921 RepID=UPI0006FAA9D6|nr:MULTISPECIES: TonB-dependent receptor [unclassified Caulobacter]KQV62625.1 TonB-dependent receptor [Caulobacter sp. Root342]KQV71758.1 TonB-dependent receptor [Caulobacter sp. Root343]
MSKNSMGRVRALHCGVSGGALALAMAFAGAASAQTAPAAAAAPADEVEAVVVTGFRASLANALDVKRRENDLVDVIKAQDIADFPDLNLAESLQRVPGVSIDRDGGEGRTITVRGLGPDFTVVRLNGLEALATTGGKDSSGGANRGRQFDFSIFASELFNSITVRKSTSAMNEEGSLGAIVDMQAARPFDFSKFTMSASGKIGWNDLSRKSDPRYTFLISNRWDTGIGEIGALLSVAYATRAQREEGSSTGRWENPSVASNSATAFPCTGAAYNPVSGPPLTCAQIGTVTGGTSPTVTAAAGTANNLWHPRIPRYGRLDYDQKRLGVTGSLQWRPTDRSTLTLDAMLAKFTNNRDETYLEIISFSRSGAGVPQTDVVNYTADSKGSLIKGSFDDVDARVEYRHDELKTEFNQLALTYDTKFGEAGHLNVVYGQSRSIQANPVQTTFSFDRYDSDGYSYDYSANDKLPNFNYGFDPTNPANFTYSPSNALGDPSLLRLRPSKAVNTFKTFRADVDYEILEGFKLRYGGDYKEYGFSSWEQRLYSRNLAATGTTFTAEAGFGLPAGTTIADVSRVISGFGRGLDLPSGVPTSWLAPDLEKLKTKLGYDCNCINANGDFRLSTLNQLGAVRAITEKDTAFYLQGDFDYDLFNIPVRGNFGVRWVKTEQKATGHYNKGATTVTVATPFGNLSESVPTDAVQTVSREYTNTLPSLNVSAQPFENFYVRFAAAKAMTRPQLQNLTPGYTANSQSAQTLTRGNPELNPMLSNNLDLSFEWYPDKETLFSVGLFQKDIKSYIQTSAVTMPWAETELPDALLTNGNTPDTLFTVTTQLNSPGGKLKGFEVSLQRPFTFLPAPFDGFGGIVNYTHVTSDIQYVIKNPTYAGTPRVQTAPAVLLTQPLLNLSPDAFNATLYYEKGPFKARVSASYRDPYLIQVAPSATNNNDVRIKEKTMNIDTQVSYNFSNFTVTLEGINLTDQEDSKLDDSTRMISEEYVHYGRQFYLGVKWKF